MAKIPLTALKPFVYAGRRLKAGQDFEASGQTDARVLIAVGHADFAPALAAEPAAEPPRTADTTAPLIAQPEPASQAGEASAQVEDQPAQQVDIPADAAPEQSAAPEPDQAPAEQPAAKRRQYRRRDMTAEGSAD